jgi:ferric iron reductase protein FhuF
MTQDVPAGLDGLGPRFQAVVGRPDGWVPAGELFGGRLDAHLAEVCEARDTTSTAIAGSLLVQQYAALLVSPALAILHRTGRLVRCDAGLVSVECRLGLPARLAFAEPPRPVGPAPAEAAAPLLVEHLGGVVDAVHRRTRAGRRVLRGAVANAVAIAYLHLSWHGDDPARYVDDARALLAVAGLDGLVRIEPVPVGGRRWMSADRRACCLVFRVASSRAAARFCATCPVTPPASRRAMFLAAVADFDGRRARER